MDSVLYYRVAFFYFLLTLSYFLLIHPTFYFYARPFAFVFCTFTLHFVHLVV